MKKLFLSLFVGLIGLISFCSAGSYTITGRTSMSVFLTDRPYNYIGLPIISKSPHGAFNVVCDLSNYNVSKDFRVQFWYLNSQGNRDGINNNQDVNGIQPYLSSKHFDYNFSSSSMPSIFLSTFSYTTAPSGFTSINFDWSCVVSGVDILDVGGGVCPECPTCPSQYTSEECQSEYGLVTSGVLNQCNNNLLSCQSSLSGCQSSLSGRNNTLNNCSNNLLSCESSLASCIQSNCPIDTGDVMWSSLWINGIQHLGKPVINVSIPDNIYWDYITNDEEFDLYVGSGYDQDYIDGIISINSYSPTSEDFTSIFVSGLTLIMPYIIFALFIVFLWKLIKRIFK